MGNNSSSSSSGARKHKKGSTNGGGRRSTSKREHSTSHREADAAPPHPAASTSPARSSSAGGAMTSDAARDTVRQPLQEAPTVTSPTGDVDAPTNHHKNNSSHAEHIKDASVSAADATSPSLSQAPASQRVPPPVLSEAAVADMRTASSDQRVPAPAHAPPASASADAISEDRATAPQAEDHVIDRVDRVDSGDASPAIWQNRTVAVDAGTAPAVLNQRGASTQSSAASEREGGRHSDSLAIPVEAPVPDPKTATAAAPTTTPCGPTMQNRLNTPRGIAGGGGGATPRGLPGSHDGGLAARNGNATTGGVASSKDNGDGGEAGPTAPRAQPQPLSWDTNTAKLSLRRWPGSALAQASQVPDSNGDEAAAFPLDEDSATDTDGDDLDTASTVEHDAAPPATGGSPDAARTRRMKVSPRLAKARAGGADSSRPPPELAETQKDSFYKDIVPPSHEVSEPKRPPPPPPPPPPPFPRGLGGDSGVLDERDEGAHATSFSGSPASSPPTWTGADIVGDGKDAHTGFPPGPMSPLFREADASSATPRFTPPPVDEDAPQSPEDSRTTGSPQMTTTSGWQQRLLMQSQRSGGSAGGVLSPRGQHPGSPGAASGFAATASVTSTDTDLVGFVPPPPFDVSSAHTPHQQAARTAHGQQAGRPSPPVQRQRKRPPLHAHEVVLPRPVGQPVAERQDLTAASAATGDIGLEPGGRNTKGGNGPLAAEASENTFLDRTPATTHAAAGLVEEQEGETASQRDGTSGRDRATEDARHPHHGSSSPHAPPSVAPSGVFRPGHRLPLESPPASEERGGGGGGGSGRSGGEDTNGLIHSGRDESSPRSSGARQTSPEAPQHARGPPPPPPPPPLPHEIPVSVEPRYRDMSMSAEDEREELTGPVRSPPSAPPPPPASTTDADGPRAADSPVDEDGDGEGSEFGAPYVFPAALVGSGGVAHGAIDALQRFSPYSNDSSSTEGPRLMGARPFAPPRRRRHTRDVHGAGITSPPSLPDVFGSDHGGTMGVPGAGSGKAGASPIGPLGHTVSSVATTVIAPILGGGGGGGGGGGDGGLSARTTGTTAGVSGGAGGVLNSTASSTSRWPSHGARLSHVYGQAVAHPLWMERSTPVQTTPRSTRQESGSSENFHFALRQVSSGLDDVNSDDRDDAEGDEDEEKEVEAAMSAEGRTGGGVRQSRGPHPRARYEPQGNAFSAGSSDAPKPGGLADSLLGADYDENEGTELWEANPGTLRRVSLPSMPATGQPHKQRHADVRGDGEDLRLQSSFLASLGATDDAVSPKVGGPASEPGLAQFERMDSANSQHDSNASTAATRHLSSNTTPLPPPLVGMPVVGVVRPAVGRSPAEGQTSPTHVLPRRRQWTPPTASSQRGPVGEAPRSARAALAKAPSPPGYVKMTGARFDSAANVMDDTAHHEIGGSSPHAFPPRRPRGSPVHAPRFAHTVHSLHASALVSAALGVDGGRRGSPESGRKTTAGAQGTLGSLSARSAPLSPPLSSRTGFAQDPFNASSGASQSAQGSIQGGGAGGDSGPWWNRNVRHTPLRASSAVLLPDPASDYDSEDSYRGLDGKDMDDGINSEEEEDEEKDASTPHTSSSAAAGGGEAPEDEREHTEGTFRERETDTHDSSEKAERKEPRGSHGPHTRKTEPSPSLDLERLGTTVSANTSFPDNHNDVEAEVDGHVATLSSNTTTPTLSVRGAVLHAAEGSSRRLHKAVRSADAATAEEEGEPIGMVGNPSREHLDESSSDRDLSKHGSTPMAAKKASHVQDNREVPHTSAERSEDSVPHRRSGSATLAAGAGGAGGRQGSSSTAQSTPSIPEVVAEAAGAATTAAAAARANRRSNSKSQEQSVSYDPTSATTTTTTTTTSGATGAGPTRTKKTHSAAATHHLREKRSRSCSSDGGATTAAAQAQRDSAFALLAAAEQTRRLGIEEAEADIFLVYALHTERALAQERCASVSGSRSREGSHSRTTSFKPAAVAAAMASALSHHERRGSGGDSLWHVNTSSSPLGLELADVSASTVSVTPTASVQMPRNTSATSMQTQFPEGTSPGTATPTLTPTVSAITVPGVNTASVPANEPERHTPPGEQEQRKPPPPQQQQQSTPPPSHTPSTLTAPFTAASESDGVVENKPQSLREEEATPEDEHTDGAAIPLVSASYVYGLGNTSMVDDAVSTMTATVATPPLAMSANSLGSSAQNSAAVAHISALTGSPGVVAPQALRFHPLASPPQPQRTALGQTHQPPPSQQQQQQQHPLGSSSPHRYHHQPTMSASDTVMLAQSPFIPSMSGGGMSLRDEEEQSAYPTPASDGLAARENGSAEERLPWPGVALRGTPADPQQQQQRGTAHRQLSTKDEEEVPPSLTDTIDLPTPSTPSYAMGAVATAPVGPSERPPSTTTEAPPPDTPTVTVVAPADADAKGDDSPTRGDDVRPNIPNLSFDVVDTSATAGIGEGDEDASRAGAQSIVSASGGTMALPVYRTQSSASPDASGAEALVPAQSARRPVTMAAGAAHDAPPEEDTIPNVSNSNEQDTTVEFSPAPSGSSPTRAVQGDVDVERRLSMQSAGGMTYGTMPSVSAPSLAPVPLPPSPSPAGAEKVRNEDRTSSRPRHGLSRPSLCSPAPDNDDEDDDGSGSKEGGQRTASRNGQEKKSPSGNAARAVGSSSPSPVRPTSLIRDESVSAGGGTATPAPRSEPSVGQVMCRYCAQPYASAKICPIEGKSHTYLRALRREEKRVKKAAQALLRQGQVREAVALLASIGLVRDPSAGSGSQTATPGSSPSPSSHRRKEHGTEQHGDTAARPSARQSPRRASLADAQARGIPLTHMTALQYTEMAQRDGRRESGGAYTASPSPLQPERMDSRHGYDSASRVYQL